MKPQRTALGINSGALRIVYTAAMLFASRLFVQLHTCMEDVLLYTQHYGTLFSCTGSKIIMILGAGIRDNFVIELTDYNAGCRNSTQQHLQTL